MPEIDRLSVAIEVDSEQLLTQQEALFKALEEGWEGIGAKAQEFTDLMGTNIIYNMEKLNEKMGETVDLQKLLEEVQRDYNVNLHQASNALLEFVNNMEKAAESSVQLDPAMMERFTQATDFGATQVQRLREAFVEVGVAIDPQKLESLSNQLQSIFILGEKYGLTLPEIFDRMTEATDKAIESLRKGKDAIDQVGTSLQDLRQKAIIDQEVNRMSEAFQKLGKAIDPQKLSSLRHQLEAIFKTGEEEGLTHTQIMKRVTEATDEAIGSLFGAQEGAGGLGQAFGMLNQLTSKFGLNLGQLLTTFGLVTAALTIIVKGAQAFINFLKESTQEAIQASEAHMRLQLSVRAYQAAMGELAPTQAQAAEAADELARNYGMAADKAEDLIAQSLFMTREFDLGAEQALALADAAAVLAQVAGIDTRSALSSVTNFMLTGYGQGLRQLGISVDKSTISLKAYEMGLISFGQEVDDTTRALVALAIVEEEANKMREDALAATDSYAGQITKANEALNTAQEELGNYLAPLQVFMEQMKTFFGVALARLVIDAIEWLHRFAGNFIAVGATISDVVQELVARLPGGAGGAGGNIFEFGAAAFEENLRRSQEQTNQILDNMKAGGRALGDVSEEGLDAAGAAWDEFSAKVYENAVKVKNEMDKLRDQFAEKAADIEQKLQDAMDKITLDFSRRRSDLAMDLVRDLADIDAESESSRIKATVDYQQKEYRLIEDHKLRLRRLEEKYILDLEDAVRERDARQVLLLQRNFNLQKKQMEEDKGLRQKRLREDFRLELKEIEDQRNIRRQERMLEYQEQLSDLALQEQRRREDARMHFELSMRDLREQHRRRLQEVAEAFLGEFKLTQDALTDIYGLLNQFLGPGGYYEELYEYIAQVAANTNLAPGGGTPSYTEGDTPLVRLTGGYQRGGTHFATSPQYIRVGEVPERIDITPLSRGSGAPKAGFGGDGAGGDGTLNIDIGLQDGLMGEIVDKSMDSLANVLVNIGRRQRAR